MWSIGDVLDIFIIFFIQENRKQLSFVSCSIDFLIFNGELVSKGTNQVYNNVFNELLQLLYLDQFNLLLILWKRFF